MMGYTREGECYGLACDATKRRTPVRRRRDQQGKWCSHDKPEGLSFSKGYGTISINAWEGTYLFLHRGRCRALDALRDAGVVVECGYSWTDAPTKRLRLVSPTSHTLRTTSSLTESEMWHRARDRGEPDKSLFPAGDATPWRAPIEHMQKTARTQAMQRCQQAHCADGGNVAYPCHFRRTFQVMASVPRTPTRVARTSEGRYRSRLTPTYTA
ncbi:hypothetical protein C8Q74DRAFT_1312042 [Fomes fomentarius]|nr:hypothetical protein C8Q74DRAFT_1312042 [Fomes fomentarius]